jgi:prenyltransferase beta subunit
LLGALEDIDIEKGVEYVKRCRNVDGGLGGMPEMESHAAYAFCGAGVLKIVDEFNQNIKKTKKLNN